MAESNYDKMQQDAARIFCESDVHGVAEKFGLESDDDFLYLEFLTQPYRVSLETSTVERGLEDGTWKIASFGAALTIYDLLAYSKPLCHPSGQFVNTKSLHLQVSSAAPSPKDFYPHQRVFFDEHIDLLPQAFSTLGAKILSDADVSFQLEVFCGLCMQVQFWAHDDEFDSSLELFWDQNALQYMHYETVWYANGFIIGKIEEELRKLL